MLTSRKAIVVLLVIVLSYVALMLGKMNFEQLQKLLSIIVPTWLASQGLEDAAKQFGDAKVEAAKVNSIAPPKGGDQ